MLKVSYAKNVRYKHRVGRAKRARGEKRDKHAEYFKTVQTILLSGHTNKRIDGRKCPRCIKKYVGYENNRDLLEDETFARHRIMSKSIHWPSLCTVCNNADKKFNKKKANASFVFDTNLGSTIATHTNGTREDMLNRLRLMRVRDNQMCKGCCIPVISIAKSGWRQESINNMYPNKLEHDETTLIENLAISCLACNRFQNKLSWEEYLEAVTTIANVPTIKNMSPLSAEEYTWLMHDYHENSFKRCPPNVKLALFLKYGRHCAVTGVEMLFKSGYWNTVSYDRFNSKLPYTVDNTRLVCKHINFVKLKNITESELQSWLAHIRSQFVVDTNPFIAIHKEHFYERQQMAEDARTANLISNPNTFFKASYDMFVKKRRKIVK